MMKINKFPRLSGLCIYCLALNTPASPLSTTTKPTNLSTIPKLSFMEKWKRQKADFTFRYPEHRGRSFTCGLEFAYRNGFFRPEFFSFNRLQGVTYEVTTLYNFPHYIYAVPNSPEEIACTDPSKLNTGYEIDELAGQVLYGVIRIELSGSSKEMMAIPIKTNPLKLVKAEGKDGTAMHAKYKFKISEDKRNIHLHSSYNNAAEVVKWSIYSRNLTRLRKMEDDEEKTNLLKSKYTLKLTASPKHAYKSYVGEINGAFESFWSDSDEKVTNTEYSSMAEFKFGASGFRKDFHYLDSISFLIPDTAGIGHDLPDNVYRDRFRPVEIILYPPKSAK